MDERGEDERKEDGRKEDERREVGKSEDERREDERKEDERREVGKSEDERRDKRREVKRREDERKEDERKEDERKENERREDEKRERYIETKLTEISGMNGDTAQPTSVFPSKFGQENMELIESRIGEFLVDMFKHPSRSIPRLFDRIHNNEKLPEYHNVYVSSERSNYAMVSNGRNFNYVPKKTVVDQIIEDMRVILNKYVDEHGDKLSNRVLKAHERYQDDLDDNPELRKELEVEICSLLLNMRMNLI